MNNSLKQCSAVAVLCFLIAATVIPLSEYASAAQSVRHNQPLGSPHAESVASVGLCTVTNSVNHLRVTRSRVFNHEAFTFPAQVSGSNTKEIRAVARELCSLPRLPRGIQCPIDFGFSYSLHFTARTGSGTVSVKAVSVDPGGCHGVRGLGATRWLAGAPQFWRVLGAAVGLAAATNATFAGALPTS